MKEAVEWKEGIETWTASYLGYSLEVRKWGYDDPGPVRYFWTINYDVFNSGFVRTLRGAKRKCVEHAKARHSVNNIKPYKG
jgi:hypothetical protein